MKLQEYTSSLIFEFLLEALDKLNYPYFEFSPSPTVFNSCLIKKIAMEN